jgi:hypothetical protein
MVGISYSYFALLHFHLIKLFSSNYQRIFNVFLFVSILVIYNVESSLKDFPKIKIQMEFLVLVKWSIFNRLIYISLRFIISILLRKFFLFNWRDVISEFLRGKVEGKGWQRHAFLLNKKTQHWKIKYF